MSCERKLSAVHQRFSLPEALVYYMAKNPTSPEVYHKLIKCCKYFWLKNSVITLSNLDHSIDDTYWVTHKIYGLEGFKKLKIENLSEKFWIHQRVSVCDIRNQLIASSLIMKIYRCDLTRLDFTCQTVSFSEFQRFTSSGSLEILYLYKTTVRNDDGTIIPIEKLIELLPRLQRLYYDNVRGDDGRQAITSETAANLNAIPHLPKIKIFTIKNIPESFNIDEFYAVPKVRTFIECLINYLIN